MGILNKIKDLLGSKSDEEQEFENAITASVNESGDVYYSTVGIADQRVYQEEVKNWDDRKKVRFIIYLVGQISRLNQLKEPWNAERQQHLLNHTRDSYMMYLLKTKLLLNDTDFENLYDAFAGGKRFKYANVEQWPLGMLVNRFVNSCKGEKISEKGRNVLQRMKYDLSEITDPNNQKERIKLIDRISSVLFEAGSDAGAVKPAFFMGEDEFSSYANGVIQGKPDTERTYWFQLVSKAQKASGSKPTKKYLEEAKGIIDELGADKFKRTTQDWFLYVTIMKEKITQHTQTFEQTTYTYSTSEFLSALNIDAIKGFVWMSSLFYDNNTIQTISKLAERSYKKIPGKGPAAGAVGNACLYALYSSKGLDGIGQLSRLKVKIKQNNTLKLIENYIREAAEKLGVTTDEIEDIAVDDFKMEHGKRTYDFDTYTCTLEITGIGKSALRWFKDDGTEQKTIPAQVKEKYDARVKKIKATQKQVDQTTAAQKERFDRMLRNNRQVTLAYFREKYLDHGLLSVVLDKVIFNFISSDRTVQAIRLNGVWTGVDSAPVDTEQFSQVSLWHPVTASADMVKQWREFLVEHKIQQPFKQAFREIYLLTEAEINTRTYSNRMASHILRQHQYVTLAKGRSWNSRLIGAWDGGDQDTAVLLLPEYNLRAEYWVNALNADEQYNTAGIWNYVTTDQIRFINTQTNQLIELIHVPPIPFSEVLRDVDLFVGVASVGNDPTWQDSGGLPAYRDYWQSYSFGDLSEVARNRKEILVSLIPRLKIAKVASVQDKFVVVQGKLRTYKIHIGSTNILMEPNDQYLCIVPDQGRKNVTENVFLPFEGDHGLSVILSKAFLLADDDKITDRTITSQINR